jgi:hypothetical protein
MGNKDTYKSLKITEYAHKVLKGYAEEHSLNMSKWVSNLIINYVKDVLPDGGDDGWPKVLTWTDETKLNESKK